MKIPDELVQKAAEAYFGGPLSHRNGLHFKRLEQAIEAVLPDILGAVADMIEAQGMCDPEYTARFVRNFGGKVAQPIDDREWGW